MRAGASTARRRCCGRASAWTPEPSRSRPADRRYRGAMRRLLPNPGETTIDDQVDQLDLIAAAHADRPYTVTNFVLTLDGRATLEGRSGPIGSDTDTAMLVGLRLTTDAVMIGAGTMRAE